MKKAAGLIALFVTIPIWFYLVHWLLRQAGAGELQMFLFWVYVPATLLMHALIKIAGDD